MTIHAYRAHAHNKKKKLVAAKINCSDEYDFFENEEHHIAAKDFEEMTKLDGKGVTLFLISKGE